MYHGIHPLCHCLICFCVFICTAYSEVETLILALIGVVFPCCLFIHTKSSPLILPLFVCLFVLYLLCLLKGKKKFNKHLFCIYYPLDTVLHIVYMITWFKNQPIHDSADFLAYCIIMLIYTFLCGHRHSKLSCITTIHG